MMTKRKKSLLLILGIYCLCGLVKDFEFLVLKTDQTFLGENIFCKLFTIVALIVCLHKLQLSWSALGFKKTGMIQSGILGLSLGAVTFAISYFIEYLILKAMGLHPTFAFYIANFTLSDQNVIGISLSALAICVFGNIINVWAEEGLFRGLLFQIGKTPIRKKPPISYKPSCSAFGMSSRLCSGCLMAASTSRPPSSLLSVTSSLPAF